MAEQAIEEIGLKKEVRISHAEDVRTWIGEKEYRLVFPRRLLNYDCSKKDIDILFVGLITDKRKAFLSPFKGKAVIKESFNGRNDKVKGNDNGYFELMARSKFVLCPDGDFTWTYRFFEAVIFKAIPIIQNDSCLYSGYHFFKSSDKLEYDLMKTERNLNKIISQMFLPEIDK
ncbi:MAG: glycosyltransferase family 47 protein [Paludibacteraceae bacterium]|jgi:hypothetical protein|nr:glycosyltransferase family 47 protein [Paludibacteraceae bacterium]MCK9615536.1 glycosyltransferase family 47 protein [Candidatus Omnitrophota bacterium]